MKIVRQKTAHGYEVFRLRVWQKCNNAPDDGWYVEVKAGKRQRMVVPKRKPMPMRRYTK